MIIVLNPRAAGNRGIEAWERLRPLLEARHPEEPLTLLRGCTSPGPEIRAAIARGERNFVAAGGDGTVHLLLNTLLAARPLHTGGLALGAIALGSSNDYHKPVQTEQCINGISCKTGFASARARDVVKASFTHDGSTMVRYFLINASVGITAEANAFFNRPDALLRRLKRSCTPAAILYAALRTLCFSENMPLSLSMPGADMIQVPLTNLGIVRNPHFSGSLRYGDEELVRPGTMDIHLCHTTGVAGRIRLLFALSRGRFDKLPRTMSARTSSLHLRAPREFILEMDGEIVRTCEAEFTVLKNHIQACP